MRDFDVRQDWKRAIIRSTNNVNNKLAIFIHGFNGGFLKTWGEFPELLLWEADQDNVLASWDFLFIGYSTLGISGIQQFSHISSLIYTAICDASNGNLPGRKGLPYSEVSLLGHSLGTLGIRQLVASANQCPDTEFGKIYSIGFFGSPLNGSLLALIGQWVAPIGASMRPNSPQMGQLKSDVTAGWGTRQWPAVELVIGSEDLVVGPNLYVWAGDKHPVQYYAVGHSLICKPLTFSDQPIGFVRRVLQ